MSRRTLEESLRREGYSLEDPSPRLSSRRRLLWTVVAVVSLSLAAGALFGRRGLLDLVRYKREHARLAEEIQALRADVALLEAEIRALREDPLAVERLAREELSLARPGEIVVFLETDPLDSPAPSVRQRLVTRPSGAVRASSTNPPRGRPGD